MTLLSVDEDQAARRAERARDALGRVTACVEAYIEHAKSHPCRPEVFMQRIDGVLASQEGQALWGFDRDRLRSMAWRCAQGLPPRAGRPRSHPRGVLEVALRYVQDAHSDGQPLTDGPGSAYQSAADILLRDLGIRISASSIRNEHRKARTKTPG